MINLLRFLSVLALLSIGLAAAPQRGKDRPCRLSKDQLDAFKILDRFDKLDTAKLPFIKVTTGSWFQEQGKPKQIVYMYGFLVRSEGARFTVRFLHWGGGVLEITRRGTLAHERIGFEPVRMQSYVAACLEQMEGKVARNLQEQETFWDRCVEPESPMNPTALAVVLSRACARRGMFKEADILWQALCERQMEAGSVTRWLGDAICDRIVLDFSDRSLTWKDLLARHVAWLETFPDHNCRRAVRKRILALEEMIKTQTKRAGALRSDRPASERSRMAELIYQLRNDSTPVQSVWVNGMIMPPVGPAPEGELNAAQELIKIGAPAVPPLLDLMEDKTLTRTVWHSSRFGGGFMVRTVRQKAYDVICEITGTSHGLSPCRKKVMGWYDAEMQRRQKAGRKKR